MATVDYTLFSTGFLAPAPAVSETTASSVTSGRTSAAGASAGCEAASDSPAGAANRRPGGKRFHRIQEVRRQQGVSLRSAARSLGADIRTIRQQEQATTDLRLSDLHKWQKALDVPVAELLVESEECLSGPVLERARMIRLMKTAAALLERAPTPAVSRMAQMLVEQLVEMMPELQHIGPWHQVGQRRSSEEFGRVVERRLTDDLFGAGGSDD